jgi:hypothetical protein
MCNSLGVGGCAGECESVCYSAALCRDVVLIKFRVRLDIPPVVINELVLVNGVV